MEFDLNTITEQGIIINSNITFGEEYLKLTQIKELNNVHVEGRLYYSITKEVIFSGKVEGIMKLNDYNTNELIDYPFNFELDEVLESDKFEEKNIKNTKNTLDLKEILWQNIVLEVPIRTSNVDEVKLKQGNGWELRDENSKKDDPRLECFRTLLDEGKE